MKKADFDKAVLTLLEINGPTSGAALRLHLALVGPKLTGPAFYQKMNELVDEGLVKAFNRMHTRYFTLP